MMELTRHYYLLICVIFDTVASQCEFPSNLRGDWLRSRDEKSFTFSSRTVVGFNFQSKSQTVDNFSCFIKDGSRYILRSERYRNIAPDTFIYIYLCYDMVAVGDKSFYVYELTEESSEIMNNERGVVISDTIQVSVSDVCTLTRNDVQYTTLVQNAALSLTVNYCPDILLGAFSYTQNSQSGCIGNSNLTACVDQYSVTAQSVGCSNEFFGYSSNGNLLCTTHLMFSTITYVTLYNKDATVDNTNTYRFTCLAIEENNGMLMVTQHPKDCTLGQSGTSVPSPGFSFTLQAFVLCPLPLETAKVEEDNIPLIVGVLVGVIILLIIIIIIILIIRGKKSRQKQKIHQYPENPPITGLSSSMQKQETTNHSEFSPANSTSVNNSTIPLISSAVIKEDKQTWSKTNNSLKYGNGSNSLTSTPSPKTPHEVFLDASGNSNHSVTSRSDTEHPAVATQPASKTSERKNNNKSLENSREHNKDIINHQSKSSEQFGGDKSVVSSINSLKKQSTDQLNNLIRQPTKPTDQFDESLDESGRPTEQSNKYIEQSNEHIEQSSKPNDTTDESSSEPVNLQGSTSGAKDCSSVKKSSQLSEITQNQHRANMNKMTNNIPNERTYPSLSPRGGTENAESSKNGKNSSSHASTSNRGIFTTFSSIFTKGSKSKKNNTNLQADKINLQADEANLQADAEESTDITFRDISNGQNKIESTKKGDPSKCGLPRDIEENRVREVHANVSVNKTHDTKISKKKTSIKDSQIVKSSTVFKESIKNNPNNKKESSKTKTSAHTAKMESVKKSKPRINSEEKSKQKANAEFQSSRFSENDSPDSGVSMRSQRVSVISSVGPMSSELVPSKKISVVSVSPSAQPCKYDPDSSKYNDAKHLQDFSVDQQSANTKRISKNKKSK